jgi:RNA polymerase subunit RPABC4/transcription elongation factor Spt4
MKINIKQLICKRCGHKWVPRTSEVTICPKCKSPYWNKNIGDMQKIVDANEKIVKELQHERDSSDKRR